METPEEKAKQEISTDVDGHTSPLKNSDGSDSFVDEIKTVYNPKQDAVLVDDTQTMDKEPKLFVFVEGVQLLCKFIQLVGDFFHLRDEKTGDVVKVQKHQSIIAALNKINYSPETTMQIDCIGDDKFKITKK